MTEAEKTQAIRLIDIFAIGPALIYAGFSRKFSPLFSDALTLTGILTIVYNGANYVAKQRSMTA
jgi:hypothetical protein